MAADLEMHLPQSVALLAFADPGYHGAAYDARAARNFGGWSRGCGLFHVDLFYTFVSAFIF